MRISSRLLIVLIAFVFSSCSDHFKTEQNVVTYKIDKKNGTEWLNGH